jgi:hypothetical protein
MLELLRSDPKTSEEEHFKLQLVSTEVERVKYLIRSYLRCRVDKVSSCGMSSAFYRILKTVTSSRSNVIRIILPSSRRCNRDSLSSSCIMRDSQSEATDESKEQDS